jgi:bacterioferritin (cytochrome b1)
VIGTKGAAVAGKFRETAIAEMKQAEEIEERLWYLNGTPTIQLAPIKVGENLKEFLEIDTKIAEEGIRLYKKIIDQAQKATG